MTANVTFAFLHHAAAFLLVAVVMAELILMRGDLTLTTARSLLRIDAVAGISATVVLVVGFVRVFYTEKGSAYYFASGTFIAKMALFVIVALLSIYPTVKFLSWRKSLRQSQLPALDASLQRRIRMLLHVELTLLFGMMLLAVMMARGIGFLG